MCDTQPRDERNALSQKEKKKKKRKKQGKRVE